MDGERHDCYGWCSRRAAGGEKPGVRRAVFLDRDGTVSVAPPVGQYICDPADLELLPGAAEAVRMVNSSGALAVIVTNQRWLSSTDRPQERSRALDERLRALLEREEAHLDATYVCPHEVGSCGCRKPEPGMFARAAAELGVNLRRSAVIGDSPTDVIAGYAAGVGTRLLICDGGPVAPGLPFDRLVEDISEAVAWAA